MQAVTHLNKVSLAIRSKLRWLAYSNILVSLSAVSSLYTAFIFLNAPIYWPSLLMLFLVTFAVYNMDRLSQTKLDMINHPERQSFLRFRKYLFHISIASYATAIIIAPSNELRLVLLSPILFFMLYKYAGVKRIYLMKNITVSIAWTVTITSIPILSGATISNQIVIAFCSFFLLKTFANAVAYDIKDIKGDSTFSVKTLPVWFGIEKTKKILYTMTLIAGCLVASYAYIFSNPAAYFISMITGYAVFFIHRIGKSDIKFLSDFMMDGEFVVMGFLAYLGSLLLLTGP